MCTLTLFPCNLLLSYLSNFVKCEIGDGLGVPLTGWQHEQFAHSITRLAIADVDLALRGDSLP